MIGTNDTTYGTPTTTPSCTSTETESNLRRIVSVAKNARSARYVHPIVILVQPPPAISWTIHAAGKTNMMYYKVRDSVECSSNNLMAVAVASTKIVDENKANLKVKGFPLWQAVHDQGFDGTTANRIVQANYLHDGVHLSGFMQAQTAGWVRNTLGTIR